MDDAKGDDVRFAQNMREARKRAGLSMEGLAQRLTELGFSCSQQTIDKIENQGRRVSMGEGVRIARALGTTADALSRPAGLASEAFGILDAARGAREAHAEVVWHARAFRDRQRSLSLRIDRATREGYADELADEIARSRPVLDLTLKEALEGDEG
jgi:transcriptional regulator with XRE-family HTH domain